MDRKAEWIWHNGDYEIRQLNACLTSRYEREVFVPPFWHTDDFCKNVKFIRRFTLSKPERLQIRANGKFNVIVNRIQAPENAYIREFQGFVDLRAGEYELIVSVYNEKEIPALYVNGETVRSDEQFLTTSNDFRYSAAGCDGLTDPESPPGPFRFSYEEVDFDILQKDRNSLLLDCRREMMGVVNLESCEGKGLVHIWYGESLAEATDKENCELTDELDFPVQTRPEVGKAFRYVHLHGEGVDLTNLKVLREFVPQARSAKFSCSDGKMEKIYAVALDTLALNTREFFLDGIKRDRWLWAGDAYQAFLMNYYSFFDLKTERRTITALAGKPPVVHFMNHIMEYSFYWIIGLYDFYMYAGDENYLRRMIPTARRIIEFARTRKTESGMIEGKEGDWVFVDWANIDNRGEVAAEQIIYLKALETMQKLCGISGDDPEEYREEYEALKKVLFDTLWDEERGVFYYSRYQGKLNPAIKKHPHIFALYFGILDDEKKKKVIQNVLLNDEAEKIVTPFMRFFELSALCLAGETDFVYHEILQYWGGMIDEGATSFWELYDKNERGDDKYAMYNRKYGKSLCHAWGASPLYLLGRYLIGLEPTKPAYEEYRLCPKLVRLSSYSATLPLRDGDIRIESAKDTLTVYAEKTDGELWLSDALFDTEGWDEARGGYKIFKLRGGVLRTVAARKKIKGED